VLVESGVGKGGGIEGHVQHSIILALPGHTPGVELRTDSLSVIRPSVTPPLSEAL